MPLSFGYFFDIFIIRGYGQRRNRDGGRREGVKEGKREGVGAGFPHPEGSRR